MKKPISPRQHGLLDYGFTALQFFLPRILGVNRLAALTYTAVATPFLIVNGLTNSGAGLRPLLPMSTHKVLDLTFLAAMGALAFSKPVRTDRKALGLTLGLVALAGMNIAFTSYRDRIRYEKDEFIEYV